MGLRFQSLESDRPEGQEEPERRKSHWGGMYLSTRWTGGTEAAQAGTIKASNLGCVAGK